MSEKPYELSVIVRTVARLLFGLILIFGFYVIVHGHITPGGGFQGGVVTALAVIMLLAAYGYEGVVTEVREKILERFESLGAIMFWTLGLVGVIATATYFADVLYKGTPGELISAGTIPLMNIAVGMKVASGVAVLVIIMSIGMYYSRKYQKAEKEGAEE